MLEPCRSLDKRHGTAPSVPNWRLEHQDGEAWWPPCLVCKGCLLTPLWQHLTFLVLPRWKRKAIHQTKWQASTYIFPSPGPIQKAKKTHKAHKPKAFHGLWCEESTQGIPKAGLQSSRVQAFHACSSACDQSHAWFNRWGAPTYGACSVKHGWFDPAFWWCWDVPWQKDIWPGQEASQAILFQLLLAEWVGRRSWQIFVPHHHEVSHLWSHGQELLWYQPQVLLELEVRRFCGQDEHFGIQCGAWSQVYKAVLQNQWQIPSAPAPPARQAGFDNAHWEPSMEIPWQKGLSLPTLLTKSFLGKRVSSLSTRHTLTKGSWHLPLTKRNFLVGTPLAKGFWSTRSLGKRLALTEGLQSFLYKTT